MVRADLLDCVERFLRLNRPHPSKPFGGLQMIFIGDLYQLPPVVSSAERGIFSNQYDSPYFFSSRIFSDPGFDMEFVELEKIYRQTEEDFIALLNAIRNRSVTDEDIVRLNRRCDSTFVPPDEDFTIHLTTTNDLAYMRNQEKLAQLPGRTYRYPGFLEGKFDKSHLPTDELLELKRGAQVMMVNNDANGRWVNGSLGRIAGVEKTPDAPDLLRVELQDGFKVDVAPYTWELFKLDFDERAGKLVTETIGSFTQYPLRLAWAVTIHKSQGKTFDKVVIDIGRGTFAHGQVYVALSRCTSFGGIVLKKEIKKSHIRMDWRVIRFLTRYQYRKADDRLSYADKLALIREAIQDRARPGDRLPQARRHQDPAPHPARVGRADGVHGKAVRGGAGATVSRGARNATSASTGCSRSGRRNRGRSGRDGPGCPLGERPHTKGRNPGETRLNSV